jgi:hypothetical protein
MVHPHQQIHREENFQHPPTLVVALEGPTHSVVLMSGLFWRQHCSDVRIILGVSIVLVSALIWCQHCSGVSIILLSALF